MNVDLNRIAIVMTMIALVGGSPSVLHAGASNRPENKASIVAVIFAYQAALNASDPEAAARLYANDGVLMPPNLPSVIGKAAIRSTYVAGTKVFTLNVKFQIDEAKQIAPDWAFVRTNSAGTMTINATGARNEEANQELFLLHRQVRGGWRIARYSFSTTKPA